MSELLTDCHHALNLGDMDLAGALLLEHMHETPDDVDAWVMLTRFLIDGGKAPFAYPIALAAAKRKKTWQTWMAVGATEAALQLSKKALVSLKKALVLMPKNEPTWNRAMLYRVMANASVQGYAFKVAEQYAELSLEIEPHPQGHSALAFAKLHQRKWREGWYHYQFQLGHAMFRDKHDYNLPEWKGEPEARVLVYGEQGLGDQIAYMSTFAGNLNQLNAHPKLKNLFARTFPDVQVFGDQFTPEFKHPVTATHQTSMATAMQWATMERRDGYLKTHRERELMWAGLLASLGSQPIIGIAWTGGMQNSDGWRTRRLGLQQLKPLLEEPYQFISLQYKDYASEIGEFYRDTGIKIHDFPWGTQTDDYEETAALVNCLDAIVCVPTTAYHLAGALGKPAMVLVHDQPHFHEGLEGDCPWWQSVEFFRRPQLGTERAIEAVIDRLQKLFSGVSRIESAEHF